MKESGHGSIDVLKVSTEGMEAVGWSVRRVYNIVVGAGVERGGKDRRIETVYPG